MKSGADSPDNLTHRSTESIVGVGFKSGCPSMSSQVVSIVFRLVSIEFRLSFDWFRFNSALFQMLHTERPSTCRLPSPPKLSDPTEGTFLSRLDIPFLCTPRSH